MGLANRDLIEANCNSSYASAMTILDRVVNRCFIGMLLLVGEDLGQVQADTNALVSSLSSSILSFYLVTTVRTNLADIVLAPKPLLADDDFVAYNTNTHEFSITAEAATRLHRELRGLNIPFVVVASGQRIYQGEFQNVLSSSMTAGCPRIDFFDRIYQTNFTINPAIFFPAIPPGADLIRGDSSNVLVRMPDGTTNVIHESPRQDVRNDRRILKAVERLFGQVKSLR